MTHTKTIDATTLLNNADANRCFELYQDLGSPHDVSHHPVRMMTTEEFGEEAFIDYSISPSGEGEVKEIYTARERGMVDRKKEHKTKKE